MNSHVSFHPKLIEIVFKWFRDIDKINSTNLIKLHVLHPIFPKSPSNSFSSHFSSMTQPQPREIWIVIVIFNVQFHLIIINLCNKLFVILI